MELATTLFKSMAANTLFPAPRPHNFLATTYIRIYSIIHFIFQNICKYSQNIKFKID